MKALTGSCIAVYSEEMREQALKNLRLEAEMREAIRTDAFVLYLQPQKSMKEHNAILRAEVLVRWQHSAEELMMPGEFIPLFERSGAIVQLDLYVFEKACRILQRANAQGHKLCLAVNVSRITMLQPDFVTSYQRLKEQYGLADGTIELEFTEDVAVENDARFRQTVIALKQQGFLCAIDDFGVGQSSLNVLQNLPIDVLKLDRRFFQVEQEPRRGYIVIANVIRMAGELGICTVAEGIEQPEQVGVLAEMGCAYIQGYVFERPLPAEEYWERYLETDALK